LIEFAMTVHRMATALKTTLAFQSADLYTSPRRS